MNESVTIRFYEELNDFLHHSKRKKPVTFYLEGRRTIKDIIESLGVPHVEVDLILANHVPVDFDYHPVKDDYISVYPVFESFDISKINLLRKEPLRDTKFILDVHLGALAKYLRMAGFDTLYRNDLQDEEIVKIASEEKRIILTRDLQILKNSRVTHGYFVRNTNPPRQIDEIVKRFDLGHQFKPFHRCLECNGIIEKVDKQTIVNQLQPGTKKSFDEFYQCNSCKKVYWKGSHYQKMVTLVQRKFNISGFFG